MNDPLLDQILAPQTVPQAIGEGTSNVIVPSNEPFTPIFPEFIDSSMMGSLKSCEELFRKTYIEHWKPRDASVHLHAGAAFAKGLEVARDAYYTGHAQRYLKVKDSDSGEEIRQWFRSFDPSFQANSDSAIALGLQALLASYGSFECPEDSAKSASRMAGAFEFYFANYPLTDDDQQPIILPGGRRGIEFSFAEPLPINHPTTGNPLLYVGRLDMLMNFAGGTFMEDDKTTTQLGASWSRQWDLRSQFTGYAWGCGKAGIHVDGAVIRGVSILKTKYDTQQAISYRPEWQIDRWYNETLEWIERAKATFLKGNWLHNLDHACAEYGGCTFRQCCASQDEKPWLEANFERRVWNPVLRNEKKL